MNIYELLEEANLSKHHLSDNLINQILNSYEFEKWREVGVVFLKGLDKNHQIPGKDIMTFIGIIDVNQKDIPLTHKQKWFFINRLIWNWDQMSCEARANLVI